jgi:hypothetical protein
VRIISDGELREALRGNASLRADFEHVLEDLAALRAWVNFGPALRRTYDDPQYPLELLDEIERTLRATPPPVTLEDLA